MFTTAPVVLALEYLNSTFNVLKHIEGTGKPFMEYPGKDDFYEGYDDFYNEFIEKKELALI